jgi:hypothetical protein
MFLFLSPGSKGERIKVRGFLRRLDGRNPHPPLSLEGRGKKERRVTV